MGDAVHAVGSKVWVTDKTEAWLKAEVIAINGDKVTVKTEQGDERTEKGIDCPRQNVETSPEEVLSSHHHHHPFIFNFYFYLKFKMAGYD